MAETIHRGPLVSLGALEQEQSNATTAAPALPFDGPSLNYQGVAFLDIRQYPFPKDGTTPGRASAFMGSPSPIIIDAIPQTFGSMVIATSQSMATTSAVAMALWTSGFTNPNPAAQFIAVNVPILPAGTTVIATAAIAVDYGFTSATTTLNSTTYNFPDNTKLTLGQWLYVGNAANANANAGFFAQVMAINTTNFTGVTLSVAAGTGICAPVGQADLYGSQLLPLASSLVPASVPNRVNPNTLAGFAKIHNPNEALARGLSITVTALASTSGTYSFLVSGWDFWRNPMTELISSTLATTSATAVWGKKAWKYIQSVTATLVTTATVSVGISDVFGFPVRVDGAQYLNVFAGNTAAINNVGFLSAVSTTGSPATNTTGDVRGTIQLSGIGGGTPLTTVATSNGALRLTVVYDIPPWNMIFGAPNNIAPVFGNAQSTT